MSAKKSEASVRKSEKSTDTIGRPQLRLAPNGLSPIHGRTSESIVEVLREAILDRVLKPGIWLRESELAREFNVSRTPIRDAFRTLASEGLLVLNANHGAVVSTLTVDDTRGLYVFRETLEVLAARLAAQHGSRECEERFSVLIPAMRTAANSGNLEELSRLNLEFHEIIVNAAGNAYLERSLTQIHNVIRRLPDKTIALAENVNESIDEHIQIAEAIVRGDVEQAETLAREHMRTLSELRIRMLLPLFSN